MAAAPFVIDLVDLGTCASPPFAHTRPVGIGPGSKYSHTNNSSGNSGSGKVPGSLSSQSTLFIAPSSRRSSKSSAVPQSSVAHSTAPETNAVPTSLAAPLFSPIRPKFGGGPHQPHIFRVDETPPFSPLVGDGARFLPDDVVDHEEAEEDGSIEDDDGDSFCAITPGGSFLVTAASHSKVVLFHRKLLSSNRQSQSRTIISASNFQTSQFSGSSAEVYALGAAKTDGGKITTIFAFEALTPKPLPFLLIGFSSGLISIVDVEDQKEILSNTWHFSSVMSASIHTRSSTDAFEELVVLYDDSTVSILDGNSLASYFTYCRKFGTSSHPIHLRTLKLESPGPIFDVVSLGPAARWGADVKASSAVVGNSIPEAHRVSTRLCTAGKSPMLSFYTLKDSGGTLFSLSGLVANTSSAMSVIAKTIWNGVSANPGVSVDSTASGSAVPAPKAVQPIMSLSDNNRSITKLLAAPPHPQLSYRNLAASLDTLGRILLIDLENGDIVRIIKGVRNAQIGWLQARGDFATPSDESIFLFLCVYSPRGVLEIISMRHGDRVVALNVGREMILVQSNPAALGALYSTFERPLASCWLVSPQNQVKEIRIKDSVALKQTRPESMMDNLLGDTDTGVLFKRIIAAPDVATQFCMLLCLPSSTSPSKTLDLLREISVEPDLNYVGPSMQTLSDSRRQASLQLNVVRQVVVVIDWIIKNSSTASSLQEEIPWKADLTPFLRLHFEVSRSSPIVNNGVPWTTDLLLCFRTEKTSKRGESLLLRIIANAHQRRILAGIFLQPLLDGRLTFDLWSTHVFNRLGLSISSWFGLFSAVSRDVSFETTTAEAAVRLCAFLAFLLERAMLDNNLQVLQDLFDHARSITSLPKSLIYIWPMRVVLGQISFKARTFFLSQVEDTFVKLGDCLHLGKSVGFELLAREKVSLLNFNETETRRAARLIATFEVERLAAGNSPVEVHAISSYFGASAMTDVVIYSCLELAQFVAMDPNRTDLFDGMLSRVRAISHPVLRTAVSAFIFQYVLSPRLIASLRLEDFSDDFDLGVLDLETPTATTFMERMRTLIGENCLVIDAGDSISADDLRTDLIDALKVPPLTPIRLFANGPVGGIISKIPTTGGTVLDSQLVLLNQSGLSLLLQGHRTPNSSRAVDLLRNSSRFGTLFSSGGRTADLYAEIDAFEDARRSFILGGL